MTDRTRNPQPGTRNREPGTGNLAILAILLLAAGLAAQSADEERSAWQYRRAVLPPAGSSSTSPLSGASVRSRRTGSSTSRRE